MFTMTNNKSSMIRMSEKGKNKLKRMKKKNESFEETIFRTRPLITNMIDKNILKELRKKSFIERNAIIQNALRDNELKNRKNRK